LSDRGGEVGYKGREERRRERMCVGMGMDREGVRGERRCERSAEGVRRAG
jgi:hypothetical protein